MLISERSEPERSEAKLKNPTTKEYYIFFGCIPARNNKK